MPTFFFDIKYRLRVIIISCLALQISKKFSDFEELHNKLNEKFSGTAFPPLPRKVLRVNDVIARERRNELDHYLKMIANVPKIVSSSTVLEFLGKYLLILLSLSVFLVVRAFAHGAMGRPIDPSWGGPIELCLVPASAPRLV